MNKAGTAVALVALGLALFASPSENIFDFSVKGNCTGQPINVTVKDLFTNEPVRADVRFQFRVEGLLVEEYENWTDQGTGALSYAPQREATYLVSINRPGYVPASVEFQVASCAECLRDDDCPTAQQCANHSCVPVTGECGYAQGHAWNYYQCCGNAACAGNEDCVSNVCVRLVGDCGFAENHTWFEYGCCADANCAPGQVCSGHACVQGPECSSDADCADSKACQNGACMAITGYCGRASGHRWIPYECCSDYDCPSMHCLEDYTCAEAEASPTPGDNVEPSCFLGFALAGMAGLGLFAFKK